MGKKKEIVKCYVYNLTCTPLKHNTICIFKNAYIHTHTHTHIYTCIHTHPRTCTKQGRVVPLVVKEMGMGDLREKVKTTMDTALKRNDELG